MYAKAAITNAEIKGLYLQHAKPGQTAYNRAFKDFYSLPVIGTIDITGYNGQPNGSISIEASDDARVIKVEVSVTNADGSLVEKGQALVQPDGFHWILQQHAGEWFGKGRQDHGNCIRPARSFIR